MAEKIITFIVDDSEDDREIRSRTLNRDKQYDYEIHSFESGSEAVDALPRIKPFLVLLDYNLPDMSGIRVLHRIMEQDQATSVIMLTGMGTKDLAIEAMKVGATDFLEKDCSLPAFIKTVHEAISRTKYRAKLQEHYLGLENRITVQNQELTEINLSLQSKVNELKDFAHVVSHDLKAPLRGITTVSNWLQDDYAKELAGEGREYLNTLQDQAKKMSHLIDALLKYSQTLRIEETMESVDIIDCINQACDMVPESNGVTIIDREKFETVRCSAIPIQEVFQNLISNAIKYNDKNECKIEISTYEDPDFHWYKVRDNGLGIEAQYFERIFALFETLEVSKTPGKHRSRTCHRAKDHRTAWGGC